MKKNVHCKIFPPSSVLEAKSARKAKQNQKQYPAFIKAFLRTNRNIWHSKPNKDFWRLGSFYWGLLLQMDNERKGIRKDFSSNRRKYHIVVFLTFGKNSENGFHEEKKFLISRRSWATKKHPRSTVIYIYPLYKHTQTHTSLLYLLNTHIKLVNILFWTIQSRSSRKTGPHP